ncbi:MAG: glutamine-hydrolyzing carbamoyl-phosphate synthase small subunit [Acidimicrobiales bacterium]
MSQIREAALVLADGSVFEGEAIGAKPPGGVAGGEVVFNTVLTGYQEVITDPSYAGQIITFTYPHVGNYGVTASDYESRRPFCRGVVVRELSRRRSSWRSDRDLNAFLEAEGVPGIAGVDTRRLARHIRSAGAMPGAFGTAPETELKQAAVGETRTDGIDLLSRVTCAAPYVAASVRDDGSKRRILALDLGMKQTIVRRLTELGTVEVFPAATGAEEILARDVDGVFVSNGPGDPAAVGYATTTIGNLIGSVPIFGICLGHQLLARAAGAETVKMPFGHHGGNHPVKNLATGRIEITSQNHNFAVEPDSFSGVAEMTHINLNDGVCEGIRLLDAPAFSVQHHPEAAPGPHDSQYLFDQFEELMDRVNGRT